MKRLLLAHSALAFIVLSACLPLGSQKPAPVTYYGADQGAGSAGVHSVLPGDTLYSISKRYGIAMRDIAAANDLHAPFDVETGQRLRLPPPQQYKVKGGDTIASVSKLFGVNSSEIVSLNRLQPPYRVASGQVLRLPTITRNNPAPSMPQYAAVQAPPSVVGEVLAPPVSRTPMDRAPQVTQPQQGQTRYVFEGQMPPQLLPAEAPVYTPPPVKVASAEARAKITAQTPKRSSAKFLRPVRGKVISTYGAKPGGLHNDGINIAAARGTPVQAAENGVVVYAGSDLKGSGNLVLVRHEGRWMTAYAHMDNITIRRGDTIRRGQAIGTVGTSGSVDQPQLHFEVRRGTEAINPQQYLEG
jgi:murein DD-endopeptidase MepM/ murein hydrolase activator NlpD